MKELTTELKEYLSDKIMEKQSPLYYGDVMKMIDDFKPKKVKTLGLFGVSQQRELLKAFLERYEEKVELLPHEPSMLIDDYFDSL